MASSVFYGLAHVFNIIFNLLTLLVIVSVALSWFSADPRNPYVQMIRSLTEPMYKPFRRLTSRFTGPFDLAPMLVILIIILLEKIIPTYLMKLSQQAY